MKSDSIFSIVNQINRGVPSLVEKNMLNDITKLNVDSGSRAMEGSDYVTAQSYFNYALTLLPENHWISSYDFSLRLFLLRSKAAFSCGDIETAYTSLKEILDKGGCLEDKLDAYSLYVSVSVSSISVLPCHKKPTHLQISFQWFIIDSNHARKS